MRLDGPCEVELEGAGLEVVGAVGDGGDGVSEASAELGAELQQAGAVGIGQQAAAVGADHR